MELKSEFIYFRRPRGMPPDDLPFYARTSGHYIVDRSYIGGGVCKPFVQLYWGISGNGLFYLDGKSYHLNPGHVCYYLPENRQYVRPQTSRWEFRWMTFTGPLAEAIMKSFNIRQEPHYAGKCPEDLFEILGREITEDSYYSQRLASAMVYQILSVASAATYSRYKTQQAFADLSERAVNLMRHSFANPDTSVDSIADMLGVHRVTLGRLCRAEIKMPPKEYLTSLRMEKAASMLVSTELPVKEISRMSGFREPNYFEKVFRKTFKTTPTEYRKTE